VISFGAPIFTIPSAAVAIVTGTIASPNSLTFQSNNIADDMLTVKA
jgi:hypothetical protein